MKNWPIKKLGEICEKIESGEWGKSQEGNNYISCKVIRGTDFYSAQNGQFDIIPTRFVEKIKVEKLQLKPGDILVEISGGSLDQPTGRILFWEKETEEPIIFSNFVKKINVKINVVDPKYFYRYWQLLYLKGRTKDYEERTTNIRNFKLKDFLENEKIPLPLLSIQQKIVKVLDTIQEGVEVQEKIIEKTKELKKSLMADLFKYGAPSFRKNRKLKKTEIGEIPGDWEVVRLGKVCQNFDYGFTTSAITEKVGPKFLRITDIQGDEVNWEEVPYCTCSELEKQKYLLKPGDVVVARIGATTGKTYFIQKDIPESVFGSYLIRIRPKADLLSKFLFIFTQTDLYWEEINLQKGGRLKGGINVPILKSILIPLPSLPEQQEIAEILQTIDQKIEIEQKKKALYEELFKTMLNKIMNQEIDVEKIKP